MSAPSKPTSRGRKIVVTVMAGIVGLGLLSSLSCNADTSAAGKPAPAPVPVSVSVDAGP
ncbi:hypothetical protein ACFQVC_06950 [Streptomyces monticola]|uniref:Uncharacterized protein n=1 Tax=Streptomyces monticola TaxID=2666263 RepID=A0ABW2JEF1_9ACTN